MKVTKVLIFILLWIGLLFFSPSIKAGIEDDVKDAVSQAQLKLASEPSRVSLQKPVYHAFVGRLSAQENAMHVTEIIAVVNTSRNHGVFIALPLSAYLSDKKTFHVVDVKVDKALKYDGQRPVEAPFFTQIEPVGRYGEKAFFIFVGDKNKTDPGKHTYVISYTVYNVSETVGNVDVVAYDLARVRKGSFIYPSEFYVVYVPKSLREFHIYLDEFEYNEHVVKQDVGTEVRIDFPIKGGTYDVLTFSGKFPAGTFAVTDKIKKLRSQGDTMIRNIKLGKALRKLVLWGSLAYAAWLIFSIYSFYQKYGKERFTKAFPPVYVLSKKLRSISPALASFIFYYENNLKLQRVLTSQILEWAVSKVLVINKEPKQPTQLTLLKRLESFRDKAEELVFNLFFKDKDTFTVAPSSFTRGELLSMIGGIRREFKERFLEHSGDSERKKLTVTVFLIAFVGLVGLFFAYPVFELAGGVLAQVANGNELFLASLTLMVPGVVWLIFSRYMGRLNQEGIDLYRELHGLYRYIKAAEVKRIKFFNDPDKLVKHFEELLPYAAMFGLFDKWVKVFKDIFKLKNIDYQAYWLRGQTLGSVEAATDAIDSVYESVDSAISKTVESMVKESGSFSSGGVSSSGGSGGGFSGGSSSGGW